MWSLLHIICLGKNIFRVYQDHVGVGARSLGATPSWTPRFGHFGVQKIMRAEKQIQLGNGAPRQSSFPDPGGPSTHPGWRSPPPHPAGESPETLLKDLLALCRNLHPSQGSAQTHHTPPPSPPPGGCSKPSKPHLKSNAPPPQRIRLKWKNVSCAKPWL